MSTIDDYKKFFGSPEFEERGQEFVTNTPWNINNHFLDIGVNESLNRTISLQISGTGYYDDWTDRTIAEFEKLANQDGIVYLADIEDKKTGDPEIDIGIWWDVNEMKANRKRDEEFSAHNYVASCSLNLERQGYFSIKDYDWNLVRETFKTISEYAIYYKGNLLPKISASLYRRHDQTLCIQLFFSFIFNDEESSQSSEFIASQLEKLIERVKPYRKGYEEYTIVLDHNEG